MPEPQLAALHSADLSLHYPPPPNCESGRSCKMFSNVSRMRPRPRSTASPNPFPLPTLHFTLHMEFPSSFSLLTLFTQVPRLPLLTCLHLLSFLSSFSPLFSSLSFPSFHTSPSSAITPFPTPNYPHFIYKLILSLRLSLRFS